MAPLSLVMVSLLQQQQDTLSLVLLQPADIQELLLKQGTDSLLLLSQVMASPLHNLDMASPQRSQGTANPLLRPVMVTLEPLQLHTLQDIPQREEYQ